MAAMGTVCPICKKNKIDVESGICTNCSYEGSMAVEG